MNQNTKDGGAESATRKSKAATSKCSTPSRRKGKLSSWNSVLVNVVFFNVVSMWITNYFQKGFRCDEVFDVIASPNLSWISEKISGKIDSYKL